VLLTFEQQNDLVSQGLATKKDDGEYTTFKYAKKVMYDYLWDTNPNLLECRGHVYYNETKELVQAAPTKTFNYLENNHWADKPLDTRVSMYRKINGYMACMTIHNRKLLVSTTGSTTSEYAKWAKDLFLTSLHKTYAGEFHTYLFEVVVPQDPHIVDEREGLHYLGSRDKKSGEFHPFDIQNVCSLQEALDISKTDRGEGFMLYDNKGNVCKLKTPYYVGKKKLMRMTAKNVELMYNSPELIQQQFPSYWNGVVEFILSTQTKEEWLNKPEQERRKILEVFA
jgi:hypothetical protein